MQEIKVLNLSDETEFENIVNAFLQEGWKISSTSCGFLNSEVYDFQTSFQAVLIREVGQITRNIICSMCGELTTLQGREHSLYCKLCQSKKDTSNTRERQSNAIKEYIIKKYRNDTELTTEDILELEREYIKTSIGKSGLPYFNKKNVDIWLSRGGVDE